MIRSQSAISTRVNSWLRSLSSAIKAGIWRSPTLTRLSTRALDTAYLAKGKYAAPKASVSNAGDGSTDRASAREEFPTRYHRFSAEYSAIQGWLHGPAAAFWDSLLEYQTRQAVSGHLLELGVHRGRAAVLLAMHARDREDCVYVDPMLRREAVDNVGSVRDGSVWLEKKSQDVHQHPEMTSRAGAFRWVHIDGDHGGQAVFRDLELAAELLCPGGIICLDDFFSANYPQITAATFEFLQQHAGFKLFCVGFNKGYVCHSESLPGLLTFIKQHGPAEMALRERKVTFCKTTFPEDYQCFGMIERVKGLDFRGPDWDPHTIML